jgi:hypothetical protein
VTEEVRYPDEWEEETGITVIDPDGWRGANGKSWYVPISRDEFMQRTMFSTLLRLPRWNEEVADENGTLKP